MSDEHTATWTLWSTLRRVGGILFVLALLPVVVYAVPQVVGADHSYTVLSSSMAPTYQAGDVVIVSEVDTSTIESGDVITFDPPPGHGMDGADRVTHRVVGVVERDGTRYFRTKGDAAEEPDGTLIPEANVIGRVTFAIPYLGYVIAFANTPLGIGTLVVLPASLLVLNEIWTLLVAPRIHAPADTDPDAEDEDVLSTD